MGWGIGAGIGKAAETYGAGIANQANVAKEDALRKEKEAAVLLMQERIYERSRRDAKTDRDENLAAQLELEDKKAGQQAKRNSRDYTAATTGVGGATQEERDNLMQYPEAIAAYQKSEGMLNAGKDAEAILERQLAEARKTGNKDVIADLEESIKSLRQERATAATAKSNQMTEIKLALVPYDTAVTAAEKRLGEVRQSPLSRPEDIAKVEKELANVRSERKRVLLSLGLSPGDDSQKTTPKGGAILDDIMGDKESQNNASSEEKAKNPATKNPLNVGGDFDNNKPVAEMKTILEGKGWKEVDGKWVSPDGRKKYSSIYVAYNIG